MVVALAISTVGTLEHIRTDINGANSPLRARHLDDDELLAVNFNRINGFVEQDIRADLLRVVHSIPKVGDDLLSICQSFDHALAILLADTKDDRAAVRVCECAIRRPEVSGNTASRPLELNGGSLALRHKPLYRFTVHHVSCRNNLSSDVPRLVYVCFSQLLICFCFTDVIIISYPGIVRKRDLPVGILEERV